MFPSPFDGASRSKTYPEAGDFRDVVAEECQLRTLGGDLVGGMEHGVLSGDLLERAWDVFDWMKQFTGTGRTGYAGRPVGRRLKEDGSVSRSLAAMADDGPLPRGLLKSGQEVRIASCPGGYMDRQGGRYPYCRAVKVTAEHPERWAVVGEVLQACAARFAQSFPDRYAIQLGVANRAHPAWVIEGTPFTTIQVNNCVPAAYHRDAGDLKEGLGVMLVLRRGSFSGFELVMPEWGVALAPGDGSLVYFDPNAWHGNVLPSAENEDWERISVVMYFRKKILGCLSPEREQERAKRRDAL